MNAPTRMRLLVSIINFRTAEMTWTCVQSALADLAGRQDALVVVIDNASGDGSADVLAERIAALPAGESPVRLIRSATNSGFSGGHNQGLAAAAADRYLILNSDAEVKPGFFDALLSAAEGAAPEYGLFSPRIEDEQGQPQNSLFRFPSLGSEVIRGAGFGPVTRALSRWDIRLPADASADQIGWASFAAILISDELWRQVGPMDEGYFMYFEDVDFCLRARKAGWRILPVPAARVIHTEGGSGNVVQSRRESSRTPPYFYASRTRYLTTALGWPGYVGSNVAWYAGRVLSLLRPLTGRTRLRASRGEAVDIWLNATRPTKGGNHAPG